MKCENDNVEIKICQPLTANCDPPSPSFGGQRLPTCILKNKQPAITHRRLLRILDKPKYVVPIREAGGKLIKPFGYKIIGNGLVLLNLRIKGFY
jgi:hypothetical protein